MELLNFLSSSNQKQIVGISLTPGIGLEAVVYDKTKNTVLNYGRKKVGYNFSTREIEDYVQFKTAIVELMDEMRILPKTPVYLILPNVYFDFIEVPPIIGDAEVKTAILSKAEEFYLFKREEPASGWCEVINSDGTSQKKLAYASFQKNAIDEIKEIITDIGLALVGIEGSYSATLRGLFLAGFVDDVILEDTSWTAMLINTNSFTLFQFDGKNLLDCSETPIAIKSFSTEEAYQAIVSSSSQLLSNFSSMRLYIISQTDDICADVLKRQMQFDREIIAIDSNKYSRKPIVEIASATDFNQANSMTLASLGAACIKTEFGLVMNVLADDPAASLGVYFTTNILGTPVDVTSEFVLKASILIGGACLIIFGSLAGICGFIDAKAQDSLSELKNQISSIDAKISEESKNEVKQEIDMNVVIDEVAAMNVSAISFYDSIATDIPKNVWLTKYYNKTGDKIAVRGIAENIVDIYEYYKNMRIVSPQSDIKLTELKVVTPDPEDKYLSNLAINKDTDRLYSFEIANTQIELTKDAQNPFQAPVNENDIIINPNNSIEKTSEQMQLAQ